MCTDTYTAGIVVKELGLLEKNLPTDGRYKDVTYHVTWNDYASGGPITNEMLAGKLNFGVMGDYPLIVNGAKFQATESLRTLYVAGTGYNLKGSGNAISRPGRLRRLQPRGPEREVGLDAGRQRRLGHAAQGPAGPAHAGDQHRAEEPGAACRSGQHRRRQDRRPRRLLPVVGDHGVPRHRAEDLRRQRDRRALPARVVVRQDFAEKYPEVVVAFIKAVYHRASGSTPTRCGRPT